MNYINEIYIGGFKCFEKESIRLRRLTVLAGSNSVGKSSVIQSILLIRSIIDELKKSPQGLEKIKLNENYLLNLGTNEDILRENHPNQKIQIDFHFTNKEIHYIFDVPLKKREIFIKIEKFPKYSELKNLVLSQKFYYLHAERIGPRPFYSINVFEYPHSGWQGEYSIQMLTELGDIFDINPQKAFQKFIEDSKNGILKFREQVVQWMNYIIPGINISSTKIEEINKVFVLYNKKTPYNVGFGISYTLPIIINGLLAEEGSIMIVENPEAHLHPSGQSRIGQFLSVIAASGVQVIVETHSEHIINGARVAVMNQKISDSDIIINFFRKK